MHRGEVIGAEASVDVKHARKALHGEACADDERKSEGDFADDESLAEEVVAAVRGGAAFFDGGVDVVADAEESRCEARDERSDDGDSEREDSYAGLDGNIFEARGFGRKEATQGADDPDGEQQRAGAANQGDDRAFDELLA